MSTNHLLFPPLPPPKAAYLLSLNPLADCPFLPLLPPPDSEDQTVQLQIRENWVVQVGAEGALLSGFHGELGNRVEIEGDPRGQEPIVVRIAVGERQRVGLRAGGREAGAAFLQVLLGLPLTQLAFHRHFQPIRKIGKGASAAVFETTSRLFPHRVAVRSFRKSRLPHPHSLSLQVSILNSLRHPSICRLFSIFQSDNSIYMVMELLCRTLLAHVRKWGFPSFAGCLGVLRQLAGGLGFLHARGVMHRDVKLENIMVRGNSREGVEVVLVDFGLARREEEMTAVRGCGTPGYMAPEMFRQGEGYGKQCDVFSMGVVFYFLQIHPLGRLLGEMPFKGGSAEEIRASNAAGVIDFEDARHAALLPEMRGMLRGMLERDPGVRLTAREVEMHPFLAGND